MVHAHAAPPPHRHNPRAPSTTDLRAMQLAGLAGLVGGALSMACGEYISVSSQKDAEEARGRVLDLCVFVCFCVWCVCVEACELQPEGLGGAVCARLLLWNPVAMCVRDSPFVANGQTKTNAPPSPSAGGH